MKSGTLFNNVLICDDPEYAKQLAEETWAKYKDVCNISFLLLPINHIFHLIFIFRLILNVVYVLQAEKAAFDEAEKKREEEVLPFIHFVVFFYQKRKVFEVPV